MLESLHFVLESETEGDAVAWLDNGTHFCVLQAREHRLAKVLGLRVCSLHQVLEALNFESEEKREWECTVYHHGCFVLGHPEQIDQIVPPIGHKLPHLSTFTEKDVPRPCVTYNSALKPLEVRLNLSSKSPQSWRVTIAPSVLLGPTFDATDTSSPHERADPFDGNRAGDGSWGHVSQDSRHPSDHDMNSPLWWSQRSDFSSICTDDLSDMDTLSQISAFYT